MLSYTVPTGLLGAFGQPERLVTILALVLATANMNPIVATVGGFHNELVVIRVGWSHENHRSASSLSVWALLSSQSV